MVRNRKETTEKSKKKLGLSTQIFIALLAGALLGVVIHYWIPSSYIKDTVIVEGVLYVIGQGFIRLMQMLVVPLVFCSLVCGSMSIGDSKTLGKVGVKTICFYLFTTALAVCIALGTAMLIHPGLGLNMSAVQKADMSSTATDSSVSLVETLLNIIPKNPIGSMANGDMLPIIVFALFVGVMLAKLGNRASVVSNFISQFNDVMMEMTMTVMKVAPAGVFCLIARTFATVGFSAFAPMLKYMGNVTLALALQCFVIYQILLFVFTRLNPIKFVKKFLPVMGFAFSTATSNATIPMSIDTLNKKMGVSKQISSFTIPLGATINMDGTSIMQGVAVIFIAEAYGIHLTPANLATVVVTATLASIGTAGIPSVGLITLAMVLNSVGLPTEGIALIMGIDRILDMLRTAVNITGDAVCTTIVSYQEKALNREVFNRDPMWFPAGTRFSSFLFFLLLKCLADAVVMQEFSFCRICFDFVQCCKAAAVRFLCLQLEVLIVYIHHKPVNVYKIVISLVRVDALVRKKISAFFCLADIQPGLFFYLTPYSLLGCFSCLCCAAGNFPPARCPGFCHNALCNQEGAIRPCNHAKHGQMKLTWFHMPVIPLHRTAGQLFVFIINIP